MKKLPLIAALVAAISIVACATSGSFQTRHKFDGPGLPPVEIELKGKIGDDGADEGTQTTSTTPSLAGLCLTTEYFDGNGNPTGTSTTPMDGSVPLAGPMPAGSAFYRSTIGPCDTDTQQDSPAPPGGEGLVAVDVRGFAGSNEWEWTAYGGRIVYNTGESNVDYIVRVLAPTYTSGQARIKWVLDQGVGASSPSWVKEVFISEVAPAPSGGGLSFRVATKGTALDLFVLVLNGKVVANSAADLNADETIKNGWVAVESLISFDDIVAGSFPGAAYKNEVYTLLDTNAQPKAWQIQSLFEHLAE